MKSESEVTIRTENNQTGRHCEIYEGEIENKNITSHCEKVEFLGYTRNFDHIMGGILLFIVFIPVIIATYFCIKIRELDNDI